jgi:PKD repeat protein
MQAPPQAQVGQAVVFDGSGSTGQVPLVSWNWDFGDGQTASGIVVQHVYRDPGTYLGQLTVTDQRGQTGTTSQQIQILAPPTPTVEPTQVPPPTTPPEQPTPTVPPEPPTNTPEPPPEPIPPQANILGPTKGYIGEPVEFDASASQPGSSAIVSYSWSFGNGEDLPASPDPRTTTIYNRAGEYEVTVFVADENGLSSFASTRINIDARLETSVWTLATMNQETLLPGTAITLQFLAGELAGFAGCNSYLGAYTATDNGDGTYSILIEQIATSQMSCPTDIMTQETDYLTSLHQVTLATIQENMITLNSPMGDLVFYLIEAE